MEAANDLAKPFSFAELLARIHVALRRRTEAASSVFQEAGRRIDFTAKQFRLAPLI